MNRQWNRFFVIGGALLLGACAANGSNSGGYQGAAEDDYEKNLAAERAAIALNNDDLYEIHRDNRIYVITDATDFKNFLSTADVPFRVTRIGGGPAGETVILGIATSESKKTGGFGSVEMWDGKREGSSKAFYAEVFKDNKWYLFGNWAAYNAYHASGSLSGFTSAGAAPDGATIMVSGDADALTTKFKSLHGG